MNKLKSIAILTSLLSFYANSGSLDVHGEIKVNGKTVIDSQGNYLGNLPNQVDRIDDLDSYLDPSFGIKKYFYRLSLLAMRYLLALGLMTTQLKM